MTKEKIQDAIINEAALKLSSVNQSQLMELDNLIDYLSRDKYEELIILLDKKTTSNNTIGRNLQYAGILESIPKQRAISFTRFSYDSQSKADQHSRIKTPKLKTNEYTRLSMVSYVNEHTPLIAIPSFSKVKHDLIELSGLEYIYASAEQAKGRTAQLWFVNPLFLTLWKQRRLEIINESKNDSDNTKIAKYTERILDFYLIPRFSENKKQSWGASIYLKHKDDIVKLESIRVIK